MTANQHDRIAGLAQTIEALTHLTSTLDDAALDF